MSTRAQPSLRVEVVQTVSDSEARARIARFFAWLMDQPDPLTACGHPGQALSAEAGHSHLGTPGSGLQDADGVSAEGRRYHRADRLGQEQEHEEKPAGARAAG